MTGFEVIWPGVSPRTETVRDERPDGGLIARIDNYCTTCDALVTSRTYVLPGDETIEYDKVKADEREDGETFFRHLQERHPELFGVEPNP